MTYKLIIPHTLIGLNEYIRAERTNRQLAAKLKAQTEADIIILCRQQLRGVNIENPVYMRYMWVERDRHRDKSNVAFAKKFIEDALIKAGVLKDDGWREIMGFSDEFGVDKQNPRVEVNIEEIRG